MAAKFATLLVGLAAAMALMPPPAHAAFENVLVMSEDADPKAVERGQPIFNRVIAALTDEMATQGIRIFDETAATLRYNDPSRTRRRDTELMTVAGLSTNPPIDIIVIFQIFVTSRDTDRYLRRLMVRISGRILNVHGGRVLTAFETSNDLLELSERTCPRNSDCEMDWVGDYGGRLAHSLGETLTAKLAALWGVGGNPSPRP